MLKSRWVSTFTVIGAILIVLGIVGLIVGPRFVYDPGQPVTGKEAWCYLVIGALMVLNGVMTPATVETHRGTHTAAKPIAKPAAAEAPTVSTEKAEETQTI